MASRLIKYNFRGNLNLPVQSSPPFPGKEKHLLKAQIVRITHNCEIVPRGLMAALEDNPDEVELAEDFKMSEFAELANLENWVHLNPYLLKVILASFSLAGLTTILIPLFQKNRKKNFKQSGLRMTPKFKDSRLLMRTKGLKNGD